jgi:hypothetical protein
MEGWVERADAIARLEEQQVRNSALDQAGEDVATGKFSRRHRGSDQRASHARADASAIDAKLGSSKLRAVPSRVEALQKRVEEQRRAIAPGARLISSLPPCPLDT